jgi:hypothetical protein
MIQKKIFAVVLLTAFSLMTNAQDTLKNKSLKPTRPREIGVSILSPVIMLAGVFDNSGRYSNLTYRYRLTERHAIRGFVGTSMGTHEIPEMIPEIVNTASQTSIYSAVNKTSKLNFQVGAGYEYLRGGKLKHGPGLDLVYCYAQEKSEHYYFSGKDTVDPQGNKRMEYTRLDTGSYVKKTDINKFGVNLHYSLRYELSRKWIVTASMIGSFRVYRTRNQYGTSTVNDFNMNGLIGDVSVFYRF